MVKKGKQNAKSGYNSDDSEFQTQGFEPRESDAEQLWDVIAIRAERNGKYLIQWAGADENGNPWPDSWVPREDVTDDLVAAWKKEKATRERERGRKLAEKRARKGQGSPAVTASRSRTESKKSTTTTSTVTPKRTRKAASVSTAGRDDTVSVSTVVSSTTKKKRKQHFISDDEGGSPVEDIVSNKKRKLGTKHSSRRTSPRKSLRSKRPNSAGEDELQPGDEQIALRRRGKSRNRVGSEEEESENDRSLAVVDTNTGRRSRTSEKTKRSSTSAVVHEHEEEEEEEAVETSETQKVPLRLVEVVVEESPTLKTKRKSAKAQSVQPPSSDRSPVRSRIMDRRPTPPRRTLPKRNPDRSNGTADSRNGLTKGKRRRGPPGIRASDLRQEFDPDASEMDLQAPAIEPEKHSEARHRSRDNEQARDRVGRISEKGDIRRKQSLPLEETIPPRDMSRAQHLLDESDDRRFVDDGDQPMFDYDDDPLPFSQEHNLANGYEAFAKDSGTKANEGPNTPGKIITKEGQPEESELSKGTVIPPTQSQSQPESRSESQSAAEDGDLQLASVIVEVGSSAPKVDSGPTEELDQECDADTHDVAFGSSIPDPERSVTSETSGKLRKKIPVLSPSKFKPYLPQPQRRLSSLPPPHVLVIQVDTTRSKSDELPSSIESPVKDFDNDSLATYQKRNTGAHPDGTTEAGAGLEDDAIEDEMPRSLDLRQRGLELAEIRRKRMREGHIPISRITLNNLLETRRGSSSKTRYEQADLIVSSVSEAQSRHTSPDDAEAETLASGHENDETQVRQSEEAYIDFDGNANASSPIPHGEVSVLDGDGGSVANDQEDKQPSAAPGQEVDDEAEILHNPVDEVDENDPFISQNYDKDRGFTPTTESSQQVNSILNDLLVRFRSLCSCSAQDDTDQDHPYTPIRSRFKLLGSPTKLESPVLQTPARQLNEAMGLLHAKSEEIEVLKRQLAESERKRLSQDDALAELQAENAVLKKTLEEKGETPGTVDEAVVEEYKEKCENLAKDLDARDAEIQLLKMSRDDATKQAEIFREMYGKASSFADEKKQENNELLERAKRAEGQATIGVDFIRKQYAVQERKLSEELEQQRILVKILTIKDRRTGDEVRRRAALEPELRDKIDNLKEEIAELKTAQSTVVRQRNDLLVEKQELTGQLEELRMDYRKQADDMSWSQIQIARLVAREKAFKRVFLTISASTHDNESDRSEERVYVCKWMTGYDGKSRCNSLFTNVQDLKDHLFVDHQL
ncbi:hypothetical protein ACEPAF_7357 [Sanghuangporus sanghuang]